MKNFLTHLMTSAVLLVSLGAAGTGLQAQTFNVHAVVPFDWQVNGHVLNAGDYEITKSSVSPVVTLRDNKNGHGAFMQVIEGTDRNTANRLVFHRYGDQYFLAAIVGASGVTSEVPISKAEKAVRSEQPREMAIVSVELKPLFN